VETAVSSRKSGDDATLLARLAMLESTLGERDARIDRLESDGRRREERIDLLTEENRWLKGQLYQRSSEKTPAEQLNPDQALLFNEAEALLAEAQNATMTITYERRRDRHGKSKLDPSLPRIEQILDVPESERICPHDGTTLKHFADDVSERLTFIPAKAEVIRTIIKKYGCPCCKGFVKSHPVPPSILPKSNASASVLAQITTAKFVDGLPLYRQEKQWARMGIHLTRGTMAGWMITLGTASVVPIINLLNDHLIAEPVMHCDETPLQVLKSDKAPTAQHWMWIRCAGPPGRRIVLFDYDPSRGGAVPLGLLTGYTGKIVTDGLEQYDNVAETLKLVHQGCWQHVRTRFDTARKAQAGGNEPGSHARAALSMIRELFMIEDRLWDKDNPVTPAERLRVREQLSLPVIEKIYAWLEALAPQVPPSMLLGKAVHYALKQKSKLVMFLEHGDLPIHNNRAENAIRPFCLGRKAWLFADTQAGAKASASLYSLVESARANGIEPHAYLTYIFDRLPLATTVADYEQLLPWTVKAALKTGAA
jgi:transposase